MFVTLHLVNKGGLELRGCIGTLSPKPLFMISHYVHSSAFEDRRFSPLREEELRQLDVAFSVLTDFEQARDYEDWEVP
jgi:AMMECR1 domain-containing protein